MSDTMQDTCPCGAAFKATAQFLSSIKPIHEQWLTEHTPCRQAWQRAQAPQPSPLQRRFSPGGFTTSAPYWQPGKVGSDE